MSGKGVLLDTNVVIDFLAGKDSVIGFLTQRLASTEPVMVSAITRMELLSFPGITDHEEAEVLEILKDLVVIPVDEQVEEASIHLRRRTRIRLPDAIIAGTANVRGIVLITSDVKLLSLQESGLDVERPSL